MVKLVRRMIPDRNIRQRYRQQLFRAAPPITTSVLRGLGRTEEEDDSQPRDPPVSPPLPEYSPHPQLRPLPFSVLAANMFEPLNTTIIRYQTSSTTRMEKVNRKIYKNGKRICTFLFLFNNFLI